MIVVDTTVLVYSVGGDHPLRAPAADVLRAIGAGEVAATTTVEVIQEFTHVRARRRGRADAVRLARDLATTLAPLTSVTGEDLSAGLDLFARHEGLGTFDAVLAAATLRIGARLVSADGAVVDALGDRALDLADPDLLARAVDRDGT